MSVNMPQFYTLPDAPSSSAPVTVSSSYTWRQTFDKKFVFIHAAAFAVNLADIAETVHAERTCGLLEQGDSGPYKASFGDLAKRDLPMDAAFTVFDALMKKAKVRFAWFVPAFVIIGKHTDGLVNGIRQCH